MTGTGSGQSSVTVHLVRSGGRLVGLFGYGDAFGVLPGAEPEDDEVETVAVCEPFEFGPAH